MLVACRRLFSLEGNEAANSTFWLFDSPMRKSVTFLCIMAHVSLSPSHALADVVKKSNSGIVHDETSRDFEKTKSFTAFPSIEECLGSGGRLPKSYANKHREIELASRATEEANREGRGYSKIYDRDLYEHWIDTDGDCQNTRHELLIAQSLEPVTFTNASKCTVKTGSWYGAMTSKTFSLASDVDIDHVVPLAYAHVRGAWSWPSAKKMAFANDEDNLRITEDNINQSKGAQGLTEFLPSNRAYRCNYIRDFDGIMKKYGLSYFKSEEREVDKMLAKCSSPH